MEANNLQTLISNLQDLVLPSPDWGIHVCDGNLILLLVKLTDLNKVDLCKSIIVSKKDDGVLQLNTCLSQTPVVVSYLNYSIKNIVELQSFVECFNKVQVCKYFAQRKYETVTCEIVGKDYSNVCGSCEAVVINPECIESSAPSSLYKCKMCSESSPSLEELKCHAYVFHDARLSYTVEPQRREEATMDVENKKLDYTCKMCGSKCDSSNALKDHELQHFNGSFKCVVCQVHFNCLDRLVTHTKKYHPRAPFIRCHRCGKTFVTARYLRTHLRTHIVQHQSFPCSKCNQKFHSQSQLEIHEKLHKTSSLHCDKCKKDFPQKEQFLLHNLTQHPKIFYSCEICHRKFEDRIHLLKHLQEHNVRSFICRLCTKKFKNYNDWLEHRVAHRPQKRFICPGCRKRFVSQFVLNKHTCVGKSHKCDVCNQEFDNHLACKMHRRGHTMQKLFNCDICKRNFSTKGNLVSHVRLHKEICGSGNVASSTETVSSTEKLKN